MSARYPFDEIVGTSTGQLVLLKLPVANVFFSKKYLILSGGFGSSQYLRERLIQNYTEAESDNRSNTGGIQILVADEP